MSEERPDSIKVEATALRKKQAVLLAITVVASLAFGFASIQEFVSVHWSNPIAFKLREMLHKAPEISDDIKLYALDDKTMASMGYDDLLIGEWERLIEGIAAQRPRVILIDKMFGSPRGQAQPNFAATMEKYQVPVVTGAFVTPSAIPGRTLLPTDTDTVNLRRYLKDGGKGNGQLRSLSGLSWLSIVGGFAYGPHPSLLKDFSQFGHVIYDGSGTVSPIVRLDQDHGLPHLAFFATNSLRLGANGATVKGKRVPLNSAGRIVVNLADMDSIRAHSASLRPLVLGMRQGLSFDKVIKKDQIIFIVPGMYTGSTDFVATPAGVIPGGFVILSLINSVIRGEWLHPIGPSLVLVLLALLAGAALGFRLGGKVFWLAWAGLEIGFVAIAVGLFSYAGLMMPWMEMAIAIGLGALTQHSLQSNFTGLQTVRLYQALGNVLSKNRLEHMIRSPERINLQPTGRVVSIMFVDIVGFSVLVEKQQARQAFTSLKTILNSLTETIHAYGGVIDKTLGDGVLAYFGYDLTGAVMNDHADQALKCAIQIQDASMKRALKMVGDKGPYPYPLRIGINSGAVFIGDLGDSKRIDVTLIGQAVNFAQRLEAACNDYCVLISTSARGMLTSPEELSVKIYKQHIQIKHHEELIEAFEIDPFHDMEEQRKTAVAAVQAFLGRSRDEKRQAVPADFGLKLVFPSGEGFVEDLSPSGLGVTTVQDTYIGKGTELLARIETTRPGLQAKLDAERLSTVICSCKWSRASSPTQFAHGFSLKNLVPEQGKRLFDLIANEFLPVVAEREKSA